MSIKSLIHSWLQDSNFIFGLIYALIGGVFSTIGSSVVIAVMVAVMFFTPKVDSLLMDVGSPFLHWANLGQYGDWFITQIIGLLNTHPVLMAGALAYLVLTASLALTLPYAFAAYTFLSKACQSGN